MRQFGAQISIVPHAFELRPAPIPQPDPQGDYIQNHWRRGVRPLAAERGLTMEVPPRPSRSRLALETAYFALEHDGFHAVHLEIFRAYFEHGQDISDPAVLERIVGAAGLSPSALRRALEAGTHTSRVHADRELAFSLGIQSVPTMLVGRDADDWETMEPVVGAVPYEWLEGAIIRALAGDRTAHARRRFRSDLPVIES